MEVSSQSQGEYPHPAIGNLPHAEWADTWRSGQLQVPWFQFDKGWQLNKWGEDKTKV